MIVKAIGVGEREGRFEEKLDLHFRRGDVGTCEWGLRRQRDDVGARVGKRVGGVDLSAGSAQPAIDPISKIS